MLSAAIVFTRPAVYALLREYAQIHPNRSTCEPEGRIEACVRFPFHYLTQREFFCHVQVSRLALCANELIWASSLPSVNLQVNVFLSFTSHL